MAITLLSKLALRAVADYLLFRGRPVETGSPAIARLDSVGLPLQEIPEYATRPGPFFHRGDVVAGGRVYDRGDARIVGGGGGVSFKCKRGREGEGETCGLFSRGSCDLKERRLGRGVRVSFCQSES